MKSFKVGDRVKYTGPYVINRLKPNPLEDLIPGIVGVICPPTIGGFENVTAVEVRFDQHRMPTGETARWWVDVDELELVVELNDSRCTNYHPDYGLGDEYRARVLLAADNTSVKEAATKFNLHPSTIYYWRKAAKEFTNA